MSSSADRGGQVLPFAWQARQKARPDPDQGVPMLVNCVVYHEGRRVHDIPVEEIGQWIGRGDSFVWVALKDATAEELTAMQQQFGLHELAVEDARHGHQRPKIEEYGDSLFAVLHLVELR